MSLSRTIGEYRQNLRYAFRPDKPRLVARLAWAVIRSKIFRSPPLRYVDFSLDFACNLRCEHCFAGSLENRGRRRMTQEDYVRVARECMRLGAVNFSFQGGEPLLFKELPERIQACCPDRNLISVTTNGTLLTDESLDRLRRAGVDILTVSLDSGLAEEHDRFRGGTGSFEKSLAGVKRALQKGFRVTLGAVVTHDTLRGEGIAALIQLARSLGVVLYLILPVPAGKWSNRRDLLLDEDDLAWIDDLTRRSRFIRTDFQANLGPYGCGAVKEILYLTPYGDVLSCPFIHISLGNVLDESVAAIRARALQNPFFAVYHGKCLASTDTEFIDKYLSKTFDAPQVPIPWHEAFPEE